MPDRIEAQGPDPSVDNARRYARIRYRLLLLDLVLSWVVLGLLQASGFSGVLARFWEHRVPNEPVAIAGYLTIFGALYYVVLLPLHVYSSFHLEHRFGLSRLRVTGWLLREAKRVAVSGGIGLVLFEGLYAILRAFPTTWTLWATVGWVGVSVVLARIFPTWLLPIFYKTAPLEDEHLVKRLVALCRKVRLTVLGVFRVDLGVETRKANAALAGLGRTRRVLLSDTLLERFSPEEIETVLAHELGHQHHRHIAKLLCLSGVGSFVAFSLVDLLARRWIEPLGLAGLSDIAGFPVLMLAFSVLGVAGLPLQNALSRRFEWQADSFAMSASGQPDAFASALRKLAQLNLADPAPPRWIEWWLYDHPSITRRIAAAEAASA